MAGAGTQVRYNVAKNPAWTSLVGGALAGAGNQMNIQQAKQNDFEKTNQELMKQYIVAMAQQNRNILPGQNITGTGDVSGLKFGDAPVDPAGLLNMAKLQEQQRVNSDPTRAFKERFAIAAAGGYEPGEKTDYAMSRFPELFGESATAAPILPRPLKKGQKLSADGAQKYLSAAGGDVKRAIQMATSDGWDVNQ